MSAQPAERHLPCPRCGSDETRRTRNYGRPLGDEQWCTSCGHRWEPGHATIAGMPNPPSPLHVIPAGRLFQVTRPGARYATHREGDERPGVWLDEATPAAPGFVDAFPEDEARSLLVTLRAIETRPRGGKGGRPAGEATTPDGKLIVKARKALGLTMSGLAGALGIQNAQLSRAMTGELPAKHRDAIKALIKSKGKRVS